MRPRPQPGTTRSYEGGKSSVSHGKAIDIISFNVEGVKGNASRLIDLSKGDSIVCLQETWLWSFESKFIDCLVPNYVSFVRCSDMNDNISNFQVPRGKGGIAIMWIGGWERASPGSRDAGG